MLQYAIGAVFILSLAAVVGIALLWIRLKMLAPPDPARALESLARDLAGTVAGAAADIAARLERTRGDIRQELSDRMRAEFGALRDSVERQLSSGRQEQANMLKLEMESLGGLTRASLEAIRNEVDPEVDSGWP